MQRGPPNCLPVSLLVGYQPPNVHFVKEEEIELLPEPVYSSTDSIFPSSTCKLPCQEDYPGPYQFDLLLNAETSTRNKWLYSQTLKKIYVSMLSKLPIQFKWIQKEAGLRVRAMLVYCSEDDFEFPVVRCPNHCSLEIPCNIGFGQHVKHVIRCDHDRAGYHKDPDSQRLSVTVPLDVPHPGTDWVTVVYTFVCKNSCAVGMNRRATAVIFTLERPNGEVIGRRKMGVRICSCPKRDREKEERDLMKRRVSEPENINPIDDSEQSVQFEEPSSVGVDNNTEIVVDEEATTDNTEEVHCEETDIEEESDEGSNSREPNVDTEKYLRVRKDSFLLPPNKKRTTADKGTKSALAIMTCMTDLAASRDEFSVFGEHVAMKLRNIKDAKVRLYLQLKISNLLFDGEMTNFGSELRHDTNDLSQLLQKSVSSSSLSDSLPSPSCSSSLPRINPHQVSSSRPSSTNSMSTRPKIGRGRISKLKPSGGS